MNIFRSPMCAALASAAFMFGTLPALAAGPSGGVNPVAVPSGGVNPGAVRLLPGQIGGPKVSASFSYADASERCASLLHVSYNYPNAPAKLIWTMVVQTVDSKLPYGIKPEPFVDHGIGPLNKSTTVAIPPNSSTDQGWGELRESRYYPGYTIPVVAPLASAQVTRPCRRPLQMQVLPPH
jgi:hypothetical protein